MSLRHPHLVAAAALIALGAPPVLSQGNRAVVDQLSTPSASSVTIPGRIRIDAQPISNRPQPLDRNVAGVAGQGRQSSNPTVASVPQHLVDLCEEHERTGSPAPDGVDCAATLLAAADAPPRPSAEESLLGVLRPLEGRTQASQQRSDTGVNADSVARQALSGDVQGEAAGAIIQAGGGPR